MPRGRRTFRERDITAAIKAAERGSGRKVHRVIIGQDGSIIVELTPPASASEPNPWDEVLVPNPWDKVLDR